MTEYSVASGAMESRCFTVRYTYRPDILETAKSMQLKKDPDETANNGYTLAVDGGEVGFRGSSAAAKDVECVLVWNPDEQAYELRQLDFALRMSAVRENPQASRHRRRPASTGNASTPHPVTASATPEPYVMPTPQLQAPSPATTPSIGAGGRFRAVGGPTQNGFEADASEANDDDFDDLANELADELGIEPPVVRAIGTAGPNLDDEEEMSEEE